MSQPALSREGCLKRLRRLREKLAELRLDAALLFDPAHVTYLTGYWCRSINARAVIVTADKTSLFAPYACEPAPTADEIVEFTWQKLCTLVDHAPRGIADAVGDRLTGVRRLGVDVLPRIGLIEKAQVIDLFPTMLTLRRTKDADEVAMLRHGIAGANAAFDVAKAMVHVPKPNVTEVDVHAAMHAAAIRSCGEAIGEFGNDFQSGTPGGPPRPRQIEVGELMTLDIGVVYRGYSSDQSRSFSVGSQPTDKQRAAHACVLAALDFAEKAVKPGASCRQLYRDVFAMLDGYNGWKFFHHLGHGIGLMCHEAPRLNPEWDDAFQAGDVITMEPGLYGPDLRGGIRIEHDYLVTDRGVEKLSTYPTDL